MSRLEHAIGIATSAESFTELIPAGRELPTAFAQSFSNAENDQRSIWLKLAQRRYVETEPLTDLTINIPPRPKGTLNITLTLTVSAEKELRVQVAIPESDFAAEYGPFPVR